MRTELTKEPMSRCQQARTPDITVITVVFNAVHGGRREQFLQCLDSVQRQRGVTIEHLVIDGGSTDGTVDLVRGFRSSTVPIRLFSEPDRGIYDGMNKGLARARGKYVAFLNSDDFYSDARGLCDSFCELERTGCDFSFAPARMIDEKSGKSVDHPNAHPVAAGIFSGMEFSHQTMVISREALHAINGFDLRYRSSADYDSVLRLIFAGYRGCRVSRCFATFRLGGFSCVNIKRSQAECGMIFADLYNRHIGTSLTDEDGLRLYLKHGFSWEMRQRLRPYYEHSFGGCPESYYLWSVFCDVTKFKKSLILADGNGMHGFVCGLLRTVLLHPVMLVRYCQAFFAAWCESGESSVPLKMRAFGRLSERLLRDRLSGASAGHNLFGWRKAHRTPKGVFVSALDFFDVSGLSYAEYWGAWAGKRLEVHVRLPSELVNARLVVRLLVGGFRVFGRNGDCRELSVAVNGNHVTSLRLPGAIPQLHTFELPDWCRQMSTLDFTLSVDATFVPSELGISSDDRPLGIAFSGLAVESC